MEGNLQVNDYLDDIKAYVIEKRRYIHQHPELSNQEFATSKLVKEELDKMGIKNEIVSEKNTGVIGVINGKNPGKTIALRADMDALPVYEKTNLEFASENEGVMHACGHDAHTAMLLGAGKILNEIKDNFDGTIYLIFQPAEEVLALEDDGAKYMMRNGDWYEKIDHIFGAHVFTSIPNGKVSVQAGGIMAGDASFDITINGKSSHAANPEESTDPVVIGSAIVMNLQTIVSRRYGANESVVCSVSTFNAGDSFNIIPQHAKLTGTIRYFKAEFKEKLQKDFREIVENTARAYGTDVEIFYEDFGFPTINSKDHSNLAKIAAEKIYGKENIIEVAKNMGGEDFSFYIQEKPGVFALIGTGHEDEEQNYPNHSEKFNICDDKLNFGSALYAQYAIEYLKSDLDK
mgnify:CR=1 FL=1